jgi:hypothetical protein
LLLAAALVHPFSLSYFHEVAGGPPKGYRHFVDSAVDWGQGLPALASYLSQQPPDTRTYLSYFGSADPGYYGIRAIPLPCFIRSVAEDDPATLASTLMPGTYCISVTQLSGLYQDWGRYTPELEKGYQEAVQVYPIRNRLLLDPRVSPADRETLQQLPERFRFYQCARLFAYLRQRGPDAQVADSINIYHLSDEEMARALAGPPIYESATTEIR